MNLAEDAINLLISAERKRVKIAAECAREYRRIFAIASVRQ